VYKLFISDEEIELNAKTKIMLSRKIFDLSDISSRGVRYTNAFTVPPTAKNLRLLGNPQALASNNTAFEVSKPYTLTVENTVVSAGRVIVKDFDEKKGAKIQLSEGVDFWTAIGGLNLRDLSLHSNDFEFTTTNMNALKSLGSSVFLTALHDARGDGTNTALTNYTYTRPFYRFRRILDAIAAQVGYSVDYGDLLSTTEMNLVGCASNADRFWFSDYKLRFEDVAVYGTLGIGAGSTIFDLGNISESSNVLTNDTYKTSYIIKGRVNAHQDTIIRFIFSDRTERFVIPKGISQINFLTDESEVSTTLEIETNLPVTFEDVYLYDAVSESEIFDVDSSYAVTGFYVLADYNLPDMTCKDFIKMLMKLFFLNPETDNLNRVIGFTRFVDDINTNNFTDLSERVQRNNAWTTGDMYGKTNYLGYANDEDLDVDLGRAIIRVENINANDVRDLVLVDQFSASKEINVSSERIVTYGIYSTADVKRESIKNRIVYFNEVGAFGFNATFAEISFQRLMSAYYFGFIENTTRERVVSFDVLLKFHEFLGIQKRPLIFNPDQGGLFLVTEISNYSDDGLTTLICLKYG
jgi:hypothetical protein